MANSIITNPVENKVATINDVYNWLKPRYERCNYPQWVKFNITYPNSVGTTSEATLTYKSDSFMERNNATYLVLRLTSITGTSLKAIYNNGLGKDLSTLYFPVILSTTSANWQNMIYYQFFASPSNSYNLVGGYYTLDQLSALNVIFKYDSHLLQGAKYICDYSGMEFANLYIGQKEGSLVPGYGNSSKKGLTESEYSNIFEISSANTKCITHDEISPRIYDQVYTLVYGDVYRNGSKTSYFPNRHDGDLKIYPPCLSGTDAFLGKTQTIGARFLGIIGSGSGKLGDIAIGYGNTGGFNNIIIRNYEGRMRFSNSSYGFNIYEFNSESEGMGHMLSPSGSTDLKVKYGDHIYFDNDPLCKPYLCPAIREGDNIGNKFYNSIVEYAKYTDAINWYYHPTLRTTKLKDVTGLDISQKIQEDSIGNAITPIVTVHSGLSTSCDYSDNFYLGWDVGETTYYIYQQEVGKLHLYKYAYRSSSSLDHQYTSNDLSQAEFNKIVNQLKWLIKVNYNVGLYAYWLNIAHTTQSAIGEFDIILEGKIDENGNTIIIKNEQVTGQWSSTPYSPTPGNGQAGLSDSRYTISINTNDYFLLGYDSTSLQAAKDNQKIIIREYTR